MSVFYDLSKTPRNILNQAIVRAIVSENNGAWFDPSDLSTLYQDAGGTTPVTAVEQPVGKILDKSGNGNHATQSITASRPTLSARKNVLLATETLATQSVTTLSATYTLSFTGTGSVTLSGTSTGTLTGNGTDRVSLTFTPTAGTLTLTVSGSVTKAQCELDAVTGPYQRVNTATDYNTDERYFPKYLRFDGIDDYLNLPYMGLYAGGSASIVIGFTPFGPDGVYERILSEANSSILNNGYHLLRGNLNGGQFGSVIVDRAGATIASNYNISLDIGKTSVASIVDTGSTFFGYKNSILGAFLNYSRPGAAITLNTTTIGASVSTTTSNYASMKLYGLIMTKSALSPAQRIQCERHLSRKAGVAL